MLPPAAHRALDRWAMALEDRLSRTAEGFRPGPGEPLERSALGPLGAIPSPPAAGGSFSCPSPAPFAGDRLLLHAHPARGTRRGTAVLVPPWKIRSRLLLASWVRALCSTGLDAWLVVPPHHLERTRPGARGGEDFVSADLGRLHASLAQSVAETRLALAMAGARGGEVALVGLSLGGLVAAWAATGAERCDAAALVAPPAHLGAIFQETPIGRRYARQARTAGAPLPHPGELVRMLEPLSPLHRRPTSGRTLVAWGLHDAIVLDGPTALASAWGAARRTYPRGHLTLLLACRGVRRDVASFLAGVG